MDCLRSLDRQTLQRFEVVVIDNSGTRKVEIPKEQSEKLRVRAFTTNATSASAPQ